MGSMPCAAFAGCTAVMAQKKLTVGGRQITVTAAGHVSLPEGMTTVPRGAFRRHTSIVSVTCPRSLVAIDSEAFLGCASLTAIHLPSRLASIGDCAFFQCSALVRVAVPTTVKTVGAAAFLGCSSLASIQFHHPASLATIGAAAFLGCGSLTAVALPASTASLDTAAFAGCRALAKATFPPGITSVGFGSFRLTSLSQVALPTTAEIRDAFPASTAVNRIAPARMRAQDRLLFLYNGVLAYKRCRPGLVSWLERVQITQGAYGPDGAARKRDRDAFESDFGPSPRSDPPPPTPAAAISSEVSSL